MEDEAYQSLADVYSKNASDAASNALAQMAAANGGRLGSGATIAADLAYQNKMAGLEAEIPGLRELAYQMYLGDKNDLRTTMGDYMYQEQQDYDRWENNLNRRIENQRYQNQQDAQKYMNEILTFGKVVSPEAADYFGVDIGTASSDAINAFRNYGLNYANMTGYMPNQNAADFGFEPNQTTLSQRQAEEENERYDTSMEYEKSRDAIDDEWRQKEFDANSILAYYDLLSKLYAGGYAGTDLYNQIFGRIK